MSKPNLFIIESLSLKDEEENRFEGRILSNILKLGGKETKYFYIRTKKELIEILKEFDNSDFRYLHISCHGNKSSIFTTIDEIRFSELGKILKPYISKKRLFISACSVINEKLKKLVIENSQCYSVIGSNQDIEFQKAAIIWSTFYYLIFNINDNSMNHKNIDSVLKKIIVTFDWKMASYFLTDKGYTNKLEFKNKIQKIKHELSLMQLIKS